MEKKKKEKYEKPKLQVIELKADEVLAVGCKNAGMMAAGGATCTVNNCIAFGS